MAEWASGNIYIRDNPLAKAGDKVAGHKHNFDHTSYVVHGSVHVRAVLPDGRIIERDFYAGQWFLVKKDVEHEITALEDRTLFHCIYSHRNPQGDVVQEHDGWHSRELGNYV
jgi:quercetin dioxygenase-like cupin family protein